MSDFKTGDRIVVAGPGTKDTPRFFLAEFQGNVYYVRGDSHRSSYSVSPDRVSAYVPPEPAFPFKVGDRIRKPGDSMLHDIVYTVMAVKGADVHLAYFKYDKVNPASGRAADPWDKWERVSDGEPATPPDLRDNQGTVWNPTGRVSPDGKPYYSMSGNVNNKTTRASLIGAGYGPLTEVDA